MSGGLLAQSDRMGPLHSLVMINGSPTVRIIGPFQWSIEDRLDSGPASSCELGQMETCKKERTKQKAHYNPTSRLYKYSVSICLPHNIFNHTVGLTVTP